MPKRVAAYCRVSTDSADQLNSLENQRSYFSREIEAKGHTLYAVYADEGLTGTKIANRDRFLQMLHDAGLDIQEVKTVTNNRIKNHIVYDVSDRNPLFEEIWIKNTSRFARNTLSYEIISLLRAKKVNIFFMSEGINTMDMSQDLLLKLMQVFDENESKDKSAKVRWGNEESAKQNRIRTSKKLYGYHYSRDDNSLTIIPEEADVIRIIFDMYSSGYGIRKIIKHLTDKGIRTRNGIPFGKTTIRNILLDEKYCGLNNALKYDTGTVFIDKHYPKPKESYTVQPCERIEPIITVEQFYRCRDICNSKINHRISVGKYAGIGPYAGLLYCGHCNCKYHRNVDKGRPFYNCSGKKFKGHEYCSNPNVSEKQVDCLIDELCDGFYDHLYILQSSQALNWLSTQVLELTSRFDTDKEAIIQSIDKELEKYNRILTRYYDLYAMDESQDDTLLTRIKQTKAEIARLTDQRNEASKDNDALAQEVLNYHRIMKKITDALDSERHRTCQLQKTERNTVLHNLSGIKVTVDENGKPVLSPELTFSRDLTAMIGTDAWIATWHDAPVETDSHVIDVTLQRINEMQPWITKHGIVS